MDCIDIVMASYNGEKYISEQIDSIVAQTHVNWRLLISDDDSTDATVSIIKSYCERDSRIMLVNSLRQGGVTQNFKKALSYSTNEYIALCDQDDYWLEDRLEKMLGYIKKCELQNGVIKPTLIFSNMFLVNDNLKMISNSFYIANGIDPKKINKFSLFWKCEAYGCTMMFNNSLLKKILPFPKVIQSHDGWFALNAAYFGNISYFDSVTLKYRQHQNNVTGGSNKNFFHKLKNLKNSLSKIHIDVKNFFSQIENFYDSSTNTLQGYNLNLFADRLRFLIKIILTNLNGKKIHGLIFGAYFLFKI